MILLWNKRCVRRSIFLFFIRYILIIGIFIFQLLANIFRVRILLIFFTHFRTIRKCIAFTIYFWWLGTVNAIWLNQKFILFLNLIFILWAFLFFFLSSLTIFFWMIINSKLLKAFLGTKWKHFTTAIDNWLLLTNFAWRLLLHLKLFLFLLFFYSIFIFLNCI